MVSGKGLGSAGELGLLIGSYSSSAEYPLPQILLGERVDGPPARGLHWTMLDEDWLLKGQ